MNFNNKVKIGIGIFVALIITIVGINLISRKGTYSLLNNYVDTIDTTVCNPSNCYYIIANFHVYNSTNSQTYDNSQSFACYVMNGTTLSDACKNAITSKKVGYWYVSDPVGALDTNNTKYTTEELLALGNYANNGSNYGSFAGVLNSAEEEPTTPEPTDPGTPGDSTKIVYKPTCVGDFVYDPNTSPKLARDASEGFTYNISNIQQNAGTYELIATLNSGYKWSDGSTEPYTINCTIAKATPTITLSKSSDNVGIDGTVKFTASASTNGTYNITTNNDNATISPTTNNGKTVEVTVTGKKEGSTVVTLSFTPTDSKNYNSTSASYEALVGNATSTIKSVEIPDSEYCKSELIYSGNEQTLTKDPGEGYTFKDNTATEVGTYRVYAELTDTDKYKWNDDTTSDKSFLCTITKSNSPTDDPTSPEPTPTNPQTGTTLIVFTWIIGIFAIGYAFWYYRRLNSNN